jgi:type IV pilus assembly protein PilE
MKIDGSGFTLVEVMIVLTVVGLLTVIAVPSYQSYVVKGKRNQARAVLMSVSQMEERYYTNNNTYYAVSAVPPNAEPQGWPNFVGNSMTARIYNIAVASSVGSTIANSYTITATPSNGFADTQCGSLTLDNTGTKGSTLGNVSPCW